MEDAREYIREAQTAEIQGDKAQAIELLRKAADLYQREGKAMRAAQMLRHAQRLGGDEPEDFDSSPPMPDLAPAKVYHLPDAPASPEPTPPPTPSADLEGATLRKLVERGPTLALPALRAWCSFCCRPSDEVGAVIAGPAGAFICRSCLDESSRLLTTQPARSPPPLQPKPALKTERRFKLVGQSSARKLVETAMRSEIGLGMIIGPEGTGKTEFLNHLEASGLGARLEPDDIARGFPDGRLFVDSAERLDLRMQERVLSALDQPKRQVFLACRGRVPKIKLALKSASEELPLYGTSALAKAIDGELGAELLERVEVVAVFTALGIEELLQITRNMIAEREKLRLPEKAILALAKSAATSGRAGHELHALIRRIPPGAWSVEKRHARKERD
jgi:ClpX C4-type zinc finger